MTTSLLRRGPDAEGHLIEGNVALGHRRLAVIDLSGGAQPMADVQRGLSVVFNGEIYNYLELNAELERAGVRAQTRSDTETLLNAYHVWGDKCVEKFNGMFAFVIHDRGRRRLFGARDRIGKKPFYYVHAGPFFAFGSEAKALLQHPSIDAQLDMESAARYLLHEFVPAPHAIYKGMKKLAGGERFFYGLDDGAMKTEQYWDVPFLESESPDGQAPEAYWIERIKSGLEAAVRRRLVSDVPLGVFLSGGIDSSAVTAAMVKLQGPGNVKTFSIGFSDSRFDESAHARSMAKFLGTQHFEERIDPQSTMDILPEVVSFLDEPFADASILPTFLLSRFARRSVTVVLGGDGGDELFAGYDTFKALPFLRFYNSAVPGFVDRGIVRPLARRLPAAYGNFSFDFKVKQFLRGAKVAENERLWRWLGAFVPEELAGLLHADVLKSLDLGKLYSSIHGLHATVVDAPPVVRDSYTYAKTYLADGVLVKVDRATMACSLEARSPLLDVEFIELANAIPAKYKVRNGALKYIFKQALLKTVPADILARPKKGFGVPVGEWFRGKLRDMLLDMLNERRLREAGIFNPAAVQALVRDHLDGRHDNRKPLWTLFMFELWRERWMRKI